ncbi:MAG TPA: c-type cytochrome domain-containing protein [Candidatus Saccharimonadales bacterium]|nr:c-type cytochrome domain-containing protein [Candidatus Saccharimonadales bacterium]
MCKRRVNGSEPSQVLTWMGVALLLLLGCLLMPALGASTNSAPAAARKVFHWRPFLAPFHSVVLHFPIGFLTAAFILEVYRFFQPSKEVRRIILFIVWLSLISGIASAALGLLRATSGDYETHALQLHRIFGLAVPGLTLATLILQHFAYRDEALRGWNFGYRALLTSTIGLVMVAGHYGGNLTHGSHYLTENAPEFVRDFLDDDSATSTPPNSAEFDEKQKFYVEKVQPILAAKCIGCHGPEKQKGGFRLDLPELALKGGKSGKPAIVPGDPTESQLIRRILLPQQNDDAMPPEGKQSLGMDEVATILDWIKAGAAFPGASASSTVTTNSVAPTNSVVNAPKPK